MPGVDFPTGVTNTTPTFLVGGDAGASAPSKTAITATGISLVGAANAAAVRTTLGLGTAALNNTGDFDAAGAAAATYAATATLTNKRIVQRITTIVSSATPTINTDNCDAVTITALATAITSMTTNLTGTPNNFDKLAFRIKDDGTARTISWGASFTPRGASLPTSTVAGKVLYVVFWYNTVTSTWDCVAVAQEQ